jgi:hypothetical protein
MNGKNPHPRNVLWKRKKKSFRNKSKKRRFKPNVKSLPQLFKRRQFTLLLREQFNTMNSNL